MFTNESTYLVIHDSMLINTIMEMIKEKFNLNNEREYFLYLDGHIACTEKNALFYNLRKCKY